MGPESKEEKWQMWRSQKLFGDLTQIVLEADEEKRKYFLSFLVSKAKN